MPERVTPRIRVYLRLGRVSNLPTVWTNVIAGAVLSGARPTPIEQFLLLAGLSCMYVAGMFLNDAFDWRVDAEQRAERPIPQGLATPTEVFGVGFGLLALGVALISPSGAVGTASALALASAIVVYDVWHHQNAFAPVVMGVCRALVYVTASFAVLGALPPEVFLAALALLAYVLGLTHAARFETLRRVRSLWALAALMAPVVLWNGAPTPLGIAFRVALFVWIGLAVQLVRSGQPGAIGRAVARLIAGITLVDAVALADADEPAWAVLAVCALPVTLRMQRRVPGT